MQTIYWKLQTENEQEVLQEAAELLRAGEVVAFPTETVYGLGANGLDGQAVAKIFAAKGRPADNPLILHIASEDSINELTTGLTPNAKALMKAFWPGPLTIIVAKSSLVPDEVSAGLDTVAVRMPSHPLAAKIIALTGKPIAAPSANISGKPSPTEASAVADDMLGKIAGIVDGGKAGIGVESTVVDTTTAVPMILRPGGITKEMLEDVLGVVELDPALEGSKDFKPRAPGMKYRHYAPQAPMYILGEESCEQLPKLVLRITGHGKRVGVLCSDKLAQKVAKNDNTCVLSYGSEVSELAEKLYSALREFDKLQVDVILASGVSDDGLGLAVMNRMRKASANQIIAFVDEEFCLKSGTHLPQFMLK